MRFDQAIRSGFRNYAEFGGRASRPAFWWWILFTTLVSAALNALSVWPLVTVPIGQTTVHTGGGLAGAWSIVVLLPTLALTVRRLRDAGFGWGHVFWILLPIAGLIVLIVLLAQPSRPPLAPPTPEAAGTPVGRVER